MVISAFLLRPTDISLRIFSLVQLYTAIYLGEDIFDTGFRGGALQGGNAELVQASIAQWFQRPMLRLDKDCVKVHYYSAIPLAIAPQIQLPPEVIARHLVDLVFQATKGRKPPASDPYAVSLQVELRTTQKGWIEWHFDAEALDLWLHHAGRSLEQFPLAMGGNKIPGEFKTEFATSPLLWQAQYTYARCHEYLSHGYPASPGESVVWRSQLEQQILVKLMVLIDDLVDQPLPPPPSFHQKSLSTLVQAFEQLERVDFRSSLEPPSQFRLGLVILIKNLLFQLIQVDLEMKIVEKI